MTVSTTAVPQTFAGNGVTVNFTFNAKILQNADLVAIDRTDADGTEALKVLTTHYTISGAGGDSCTVTMLVAPAVGHTLVLYADPSIIQSVNLTENGSAPAETQETALDRLTLFCQRLKSLSTRSLRLRDGYSPSFTMTLPAEMTADAVLAVNPAGDGWVMGPTIGDIASVGSDAAAAAASAAAAATSASAASTSQSAAATSATAAAASATAAAGSATTASTQATNAATSATAAATSATAAAASATAAAGSATTATTQATNAAASAAAAATSETNADSASGDAFVSAAAAATSATAAAASATAAAGSATSAATDAAAILFRWGGAVGGTGDAITLTPSPALGAYGSGNRFVFVATASNTGASTVNVSGLGAKSIKTQDGSATPSGYIASGSMYTLTYDGTNFRVIETSTPGSQAVTVDKLDRTTTVPIGNAIRNYSLACSVGSSALTIALKDQGGTDATATTPITIPFRNATSATGTPAFGTVTGALSTVISSGSTAGHTSGVAWPLYVYAILNGSTVELAWSATLYQAGGLITTTAEGGAGAADTYTTVYSTTARTNVPFRLLGRLTSNQATAGTYAAVPTEIALPPFDQGSIISAAGSVGMRICSAYITNSGTPTVSLQDGSWISSLTDNGTGDTTIVPVSNTFSNAPRAMASQQSSSSAGDISNAVASTSTAIRIYTQDGANGAADRPFYVIAMGAA